MLGCISLITNVWVPFTHEIVDKENSTSKFIKNYNSQNNLECLTESYGVSFSVVTQMLIPYSLMITFTTLLIYFMFKSRMGVLSDYSTSKQNRRFQRDLRFALSALSLNIIYILLNLPIGITYHLDKSFTNLNLFCYDLFLFSFSINFYLLFIFNTLFRNVFLSFFRKCLPKTNSNEINNNINNLISNSSSVNPVRSRNMDLSFALNNTNIAETCL